MVDMTQMLVRIKQGRALGLLPAVLVMLLAGSLHAADQSFDVKVTADSTQVMAGSKPIGEIPKGTTLTVNLTNAEWYLIDMPEANPPQQAWVRKSDVQRITGAPPALHFTVEQNTLLDGANTLAARVAELCNAGRYNAALPAAEKAAVIRKQVLGDRHPDYATSLHNLGEVCR
jgi:hypothetical protein